MSKIKRTILYGLLITVIASFASLVIGIYANTNYFVQNEKSFWIVWLASLIPTAISGFISAFLYHYLCDSKKRWVHILWFILNLLFILAFGAFIAFVVLNSMLN
ncbi:MAG: hypothetical protein AAF462_10580 [Thermodesulfobacteriota bacterium]